MLDILLICMIPLAFIAGVFCCLKSVQLGLKWNIETKQNITPTMDIPNPIQPIMEKKQEEQIQSILDEYLNGPKER